MTRPSIPRKAIATDRLTLRPTSGTDADRAFEIQSDRDVTRMLSMATFPPDRHEMRTWFADHQREWLAGEAYHFAVDLNGRMVGVVDLSGINGGEGNLGYWFERFAWGCGYALEGARAVVRFAFEEVGLAMLKAGHAADNPASGKVLASQPNVRRVKAGVLIEELAEDIARRTLLQSLNVRPLLDAEGVEIGMFKVPQRS